VTNNVAVAEADVTPRSRAAWASTDWYVVTAIGVTAFLFAHWYGAVYRAGGGVPSFYQDQFGPAVMLACGRGFIGVDSDVVPAFKAFLHQERATLSCDEVPAAARLIPLNGLQGATRYLMTTAALMWRLTGVSWRALDVIASALFAATIAAAYAAARAVCGRPLSLLIVFAWAFSPRHLENLPHLRDYSKALFFILMLLAMGILFLERRPKRRLAIGIVFGAVQGIGFGMRTDVILNFIPFFLVLFAASSDGLLKDLRSKTASAAAAVIAFAIVAFPVVRTYVSDMSLWHVALLGLTSPYDENLAIGFPRTAYSFPYAYNDSYIEAVVGSYWSRQHPGDPPLRMLTRPYDRACREYFMRLAQTFPGDMLARGVASTIGVLNLPFVLPEGHVPLGIMRGRLAWLWERRARMMTSLEGWGPPLVAATIAVIGTYRIFYACLAFVLVWFWGTFPAVEFHGRHTFHLEFAVLAAIAWGTALLIDLVLSNRWRDPAGHWQRRTLKSIATVTLLFATVGLAVVLARAVQMSRARALLMAYASAASVPIEATTTPMSNGQVRLAVDLFPRLPERRIDQEAVLEAEFDFARCGTPPALAATFSYEAGNSWFDQLSRKTAFDYLGAPTRVFLPVYVLTRESNVVARFAGVDVPASFATCVRLSRLTDPGRLALLLPVTLEPDWSRKLYQRVRPGWGLGY
jgi:hypothetical protein